MKFISILALILSISACQQATDDKKITEENKESVVAQQPTSKESKVKPPAVAEHSHSHEETVAVANPAVSPLIETPYEIVESDEACETPIVMEFFAYQCPHCFKLESHAQAWKTENAGKVAFKAVPTHLGHQEFGAFLIIHHAAENLGILSKATPALFKRLHEQKQGFSSQDEAVNFLATLGVSKEAAKTALEEEERLKTAIDEDFRLLAKYKISGVPTILVNHKYKFDVTRAGGYDKVFEVVKQTLAMPSNCSDK